MVQRIIFLVRELITDLISAQVYKDLVPFRILLSSRLMLVKDESHTKSKFFKKHKFLKLCPKMTVPRVIFYKTDDFKYSEK